MRISESMIRYYLDTVTVGYFDDHDLPPDDVQGYEIQVRAIGLKMAKHGDSTSLRLALAFLLSNATLDLSTFNGGRYPFDDAEMREIVHFAYEYLFPNDKGPPQDEVMRVEIVQVPLNEWWGRRIEPPGTP